MVLDRSNVETRYVRYTFHDSFRNNQFMGRLEYYRRDYNESGSLELRRGSRSTYRVFWLVLLGSYLALGILGSIRG